MLGCKSTQPYGSIDESEGRGLEAARCLAVLIVGQRLMSGCIFVEMVFCLGPWAVKNQEHQVNVMNEIRDVEELSFHSNERC